MKDMIRTLRYACMALLLAAAGCSDREEVFYTATYAVVDVEVVVTLPAPAPAPAPTPDPGEDPPSEPEGGKTDEAETEEGESGSGDTADSGMEDGSPVATGGELPAGSLTAEQITDAVTAEVLAFSPVAAGGSYRLEFTEADCGALHVAATAQGPLYRGAFRKVPGSKELRLYYTDAASQYAYTCQLNDYRAEGIDRTVLVTDLTDRCRELHPDWELLRVVRYEYTSTPY